MRAVRTTALAAGGCLLAIGADGPRAAMAQGVIDTPRPDYDPKGMPIGAFRLFPTADLHLTFDDNVYRRQTDEIADEFFTIEAGLLFQSQWSVHMLELSAGLTDYEYTTLTTEDRFDWNVGGAGRLDIVRGSNITVNALHRSTHELRLSPDQSALAEKPTPYSLSHVDVTILHQPNRFGISAGAMLDGYDYDLTSLIDGTTLSNEDRNHTTSQLWGKLGYEFSPGYSAFLRTAYMSDRFDEDLDRSGLNRDAEGYTVDAGLDLLVTNLIAGQVFAGYLNQDYVAPLVDIRGFNFGAALEWYATSTLTLRLAASRVPSATTIAFASAQDNHNIGAGFDYEFRSNILVQGDVQYTRAAFPGTEREDKLATGRIGVRYLMNLYMSADARYEFSSRDSTALGQNFDDNMIMIGLRLQE